MPFSPLISVIIPAYNAEKTISKTLDSVYHEAAFVPLEIIVVNDGSTDGTASILKEYGNRCQVIETENRGAGAARQLALDVSNGKYIQYLDADDLLEPGKLSLQIKALSENGSDIAYGDWQKFEEVNGKVRKLDIVWQTFKTETDLFTDFWAPPAALLFTREITRKISWSKTLPIIQDARYLLDAVMQGGKPIHTPGITALYRTHQQTSLSQRSKTAFVNDCFTNAKEVYELWKDELKENTGKKEALIKALRYCITEFSLSDKVRFNEAITILLHIQPRFVPQKSTVMNILSRFTGYRFAERFASVKRKLFLR